MGLKFEAFFGDFEVSNFVDEPGVLRRVLKNFVFFWICLFSSFLAEQPGLKFGLLCKV